jgi:hypothetical protein
MCDVEVSGICNLLKVASILVSRVVAVLMVMILTRQNWLSEYAVDGALKYQSQKVVKL